MAPRKRSRANDDIDGDVEIEVESANSSFQMTHHNKRPRVSHRDGSTTPYEDEFLVSSPGREGTAEPSMLDESSDNESESESVDELQATQMVKQQMQKTGENMASEQGVIMEIVIRNFMCHKNMRVPFGPLINFITGANGSGKSAILTALQVCLGTKAKSTNRAPNLLSMVKTGEESASLAVRIKNEGEDAYKPKEYGASILVERHFTRSGSSSFKIKNDAGKIMTTKKKDLDEITEHFGLQLDNPINVLTQDRAREFLSNSTPAEKYKFFIQGTQLQALDGDYNLMEEKLDMIEEAARIAAGDLELYKEKAQKAEERKKRLDRAAIMQEKIQDVFRQNAWCQVEEQEQLLERMKGDVSAQAEIVQERRETAEEAGNAYEAQNTAYESAQRAIDELKEQLGPQKEKQLKAKEAFDSNKGELLKSQNEQRNIKGSWQSAKANVTRLENEITEEDRRISGTVGEAHELRQQELEELKDAAQQAKQAYTDHQDATKDREKNKAEAEKLFIQQKPEVEKAREELRAAERALSATQQAEGNPLAGYDRRMQDLLRTINAETRWRTKPVGPMGRYVRITEPEWTSILEKTFGAALNSFVVTDKYDMDLLNEILRKKQIPGISVFLNRSRDPLDISGKEPSPELSTVYRILTIDDDAVRNTLIINQAIEQLVLVRDRAEAQSIMFPANGNRVNIRAVLTHAAARGHGFRIESTRTGGKRTTPIQAWTGGYRMKADREQQLQEQQSARDDAKRKEDGEVQKLKALERALTEASQLLERHRRTTKSLKESSQRADDRVDAKQTEIESNMPQTGRLEELKRQLVEARQDVQSAFGQLEDIIKAKAALDENAKSLKKDLDDEQRELDLINGRILKEQDRSTKCEQNRTEALYAKNKALDNVKVQVEQLERLERKVAAQESTLVEEFLPGAERICPRIAVEAGMTSEMLADRMKTLEARYQAEEQQAGGSLEELTAAHRKAQKEYEDKRKALRSQKATAKGLKDARRERRRRWGLFRKYITARARSNFQYLLSERQFRGRVLMDHVDKTLNISVEPDVTRTSDSGRQANTLSGGEKSFSQICLLLSIWEAMGSPIRCLDEFDVFMDNVNRDMSIQIMVDAARRSVGRQFILITPNSMDRVPDAGDVKKFRMPDPNRGRERGQLPLPGAS